MTLRPQKKWLLLIPALLGLGSILLAVFAGQLGIDRNVGWGVRRILALALGALLLLAPLAWLAMRRPSAGAVTGATRLRAVFFSVITTLCVLIVLGAYVWFVSLGRWTAWPVTGYRYDQLAGAFLRGQLNIEVQLDPTLSKLPDPYDPEARKDIQGLVDIWDMSLYHGKIYVYFGAAPALILSGVKLLDPGPISDGTVTFASICGLFICEVLLILLIRRRFFDDLPGWTMALGLIVLGLVHPVPWMLTDPRIYETAVAAGQFFLVAGFLAAFVGFFRSTPAAWPWVLAGMLWSLAVGTRAVLVIPIAFLVPMAVLRMRHVAHETAQRHDFLRPFLALTLPLIMGAIVLGWYDWARFGSVLETGFRYQVGMVDLNKHAADIFSFVHVPPNLYIYLINPPAIGPVFPFIRPVWAQDLVTYYSNAFPGVYNAERITGIVYSTPFILLATISGATALASLGDKRSRSADNRDAQGLLRWTVLSMLGGFGLTLVSLLLYFYGTVRYLLEIMPFSVMPAMVGFWQGYRALRARPWFLVPYAALSIGLAVVSVLSGLLLAFSSDTQWIRLNNPSLLPHLIQFFSGLARRFGF